MGSVVNVIVKMASWLQRISVLAEKTAFNKGIKLTSASAPCSPRRQQPMQNQQVRNLSVHEYVSMSLLKDAGVPTPKFGVATTVEEARKIAEDLGTKDLVVKAQVLAGGRGKGKFKKGGKGGVKLVYSPDEVAEAASGMLNDLLVTKQTGEAGRICNSVMITERKYTRKEFYIAFMNERAFAGPVMIASSEGGVNIEEVAEKNPDAIVKFPISINDGLSEAEAKDAAAKLGFPADRQDEVAKVLVNLYQLFLSKDATMVEINPFAEDADFRQKEVFDQRDWTQEDPSEVETANYNLNYISLDGDIGCMVNGAGLAMATMDIIKLHG